MKPIIIFKEKNKDGKFEFTQKELEKLLQDAYDQGVFDYAAAHPIISTTPATIPQTAPFSPLISYDRIPCSSSDCINTTTSKYDPSIIAHNGGQNESRNQ